MEREPEKEGFRGFRAVSRHAKGLCPGAKVEKDLFLVQVRGRFRVAHSNRILNFFNNRFTNASAESFNTKLKDFRTQFRGLDIKFFLFRVVKIFA